MVDEQLEQIEGVVEDIIYENEDNGYVVFEISGGGVLTVVCGIVGELHAGESVICRGRYENHATYGRQFHAQECETDMPKDLEAVYAFLASRSLPYIGAKTADKIIDMFGAEALEVIANDPARLTEAFGLYALTGKATSFLAPLLIAVTTDLSGSQRIGISPLIALFLIGLLLLAYVKPEGEKQA